MSGARLYRLVPVPSDAESLEPGRYLAVEDGEPLPLELDVRRRVPREDVAVRLRSLVRGWDVDLFST